ncbi:hypothetical protein LINPERHAP1_LOCUS21102 [Linum perenne]
MNEQPVNPRCPKIVFSEEEVKALYKPWSRALVVKVLEKSFSFPAMKRRLDFLWAHTGHIQVSDMSNNFFLVRFSNEDDYASAAFGGPWKMYDYYIAVSQWSPSFNEEEEIKSILTWVRLPKLPIQYFNSLAVHRIGNTIGRTVRLDLATSEGSRCRYARVCVEIDLTKPLLGKYMIEDRVLKIEYESLENVCVECGIYGHKRESCAVSNTQKQGTEPSNKPTEQGPTRADPDTGDWMIVQRRNRRKPSSVTNQPKQLTGDGSRFSSLQPEVPESGVIPTNAVTEVHAEWPIALSAEERKLEQLKAGLDGALETQENSSMREETQMKQMKSSREALGDISNTWSANQSSQPKEVSVEPSAQAESRIDSEDGLIPVTVVYQNPTFRSQVSGPKPLRAKGKNSQQTSKARDKAVASSPALLVNKKRSLKITSKTAGLKTPILDHHYNDGNPGVNSRKPPDRS